jgi:hypothetical protein
MVLSLPGSSAKRYEASKRPICCVALVPRRSTYAKYASLLGMSGALHLDLFEQPFRDRLRAAGKKKKSPCIPLS